MKKQMDKRLELKALVIVFHTIFEVKRDYHLLKKLEYLDFDRFRKENRYHSRFSMDTTYIDWIYFFNISPLFRFKRVILILEVIVVWKTLEHNDRL
jgi:hypothetical protein